MDYNIVDSNTLDSTTSSFWWNSMTVFLVRMGKLVVGIGSVVATLLYFKQDSMLYFPEVGGIPRRPRDNPRRYRSPSEHQIPYESYQIPCADGVHIHAWLLVRRPNSQPNQPSQPSSSTTITTTLPVPKNTNPTIIFFHGNAGNIGLRLPNALQMLQYLNANILLVEYRGYGDSDSVKPSEKGLKLDGQAAIQFIFESTHIQQHYNLDLNSIFLFGRSLGGAVALETALYAQQQQNQNQQPKFPIAGVIVENTFLSIASMVDHLMPVIAPLKGLVLRIGWNNSLIVPQLTIPILYLAGAKDVLVPHTHMKQLYETTSKQSKLKQLHIIPDGTHNETWMQGGQEYWDTIVSFVKHAVIVSSTTATTTTMGVGVGGGSSVDSTTRTTSSTMMAADMGSSNSAIPLMPTGFMNMARESIRATDGTTTTASSSSIMDPSKKKM